MYLPDEGVYRSIEELQGRGGLWVLAVDDETGRLERRRATRAFATGRMPVYRLTTRLGRTIRATGNHKFLAFDGWRRLDDMAPGMEIATPRELPGPDERTMSDQQLAILGHLLRDPVSARERRIPAEVFAQPAPAIAVFLLHLCTPGALVGPRAEGFVYPISFASRSAQLVRDLQSLFLRLGIVAGRRIEADGNGGVHRLDIAETAHLKRYQSLVGFGQRRATAGVTAGAAAPTPRSSASWRPLAEPDHGWGDAVWDEIASIEHGGEDDVYDLTVEELHSFVAEDVIVHNSLDAQGIAEVHLAKHPSGPSG